MIGGAAILIVGLYLLTQLDETATPWDVGWRLFIVGVGLGPSQSLFTLVAQNAAPMRQVGAATSTSQFCRQIGSMVGVAVLGALLIQRVGTELAQIGLVDGRISLGNLEAFAMDVAVTTAAGLTVPAEVAVAVTGGMQLLFYAALAIAAAGFAAILLIPHAELREGFEVHAEPVAEPGEGAANVVEGGFKRL